MKYYRNKVEDEYDVYDIVPFIPDKFSFDVIRLQLYVGEDNFRRGLTIETSLAEMYVVCPRERERSDAYDALIKFLKKELEIDLIISNNNRYGTISDTPW